MIENEKYPKLKNLIGGYLHQDWEHGYDWAENEPHYAPVIRFYKTHNPSATVQRAESELKNLLSLDLDEDTLEKILENTFILGVYVPYWKITHRDFLEDVLKILEEPMEKTRKSFIPEFKG